MMQKKGNDPKYVAQVILSRRDHAEAEMRKKLKRKHFSLSEIEETIFWLKQQKLLNDEEFVRSYVENVLNFKAVGPRWISFKLQGKGVAKTLVSNILAEKYPIEEQNKIARQAIRQWQTTHQKHRDDKTRLMRFLSSRGFSSGCISEAMEYIRHREELLRRSNLMAG